MVCLLDQLTVWKSANGQRPPPSPGKKRQTSVLDAIFLEYAMRPVTYTPYNLDTTGSTGGNGIYRILFLFGTVVNVETLFESAAHFMPSFAVRVTWLLHKNLDQRYGNWRVALTSHGFSWGGFNIMWKGEPFVMTEDTRSAFVKSKV